MPVRPRRRAHRHGERARRRLEVDVRRVPRAPGEELRRSPGPVLDEDYARYVDGRPRLDGTRAFLASRGIGLPEGDPTDEPGAPTVHGLSTRKNDLVLKELADHVAVYDGSVRYVHAARAAGLATAVVSSSANAKAVLQIGRAHV